MLALRANMETVLASERIRNRCWQCKLMNRFRDERVSRATRAYIREIP